MELAGHQLLKIIAEIFFMQQKKQINTIFFCLSIIALLGVYFFQPIPVLAANTPPTQSVQIRFSPSTAFIEVTNNAVFNVHPNETYVIIITSDDVDGPSGDQIKRTCTKINIPDFDGLCPILNFEAPALTTRFPFTIPSDASGNIPITIATFDLATAFTQVSFTLHVIRPDGVLPTQVVKLRPGGTSDWKVIANNDVITAERGQTFVINIASDHPLKEQIKRTCALDEAKLPDFKGLCQINTFSAPMLMTQFNFKIPADAPDSIGPIKIRTEDLGGDYAEVSFSFNITSPAASTVASPTPEEMPPTLEAAGPSPSGLRWKFLNPTNLNPNASVKSMREALGRIALLITGLAGALALALFILGAIYMMTSAGNKQRAQRGKEIITWTLIGLIGILLSYFLLRYILKIF
ncbi:MAG: hypothetical protein A2Y67_02285 [Candidatus Buchananbacteria bacterium RBG_13_39_9]|uniref:Uncharacterized protein n=1 Tax=Candidatus Buchananbacteria bacterium RBG_13_39_9 TaxID=1797531 RepID=A0A1G1XMP9_9BACT|nr:MAG: hypothetical protein A2Y67_02285 [Candidatus Buchananbacteria bacterium RBG_13_39_9]